MVYLKQIFGLLLIIVGLFGFYFFKNYAGESIPFPTLWFIISIATGLLGLFLTFHNSYKVDKKFIDAYHEEIKQAKAKSEKKVVDIDHRLYSRG
jgi:hypothetical protein